MQLGKPGLHGLGQFQAQVFQPVLDFVQMYGRIGLTGGKGRKAAHMPLTGDGRRHAVNPAGNGPRRVKQATVVLPQQRAAQFDLGGALHNDAGVFTVLFGPVEVALETRGLSVQVGGALQHGRTLRPVGEVLRKGLVDVHGLHPAVRRP